MIEQRILTVVKKRGKKTRFIPTKVEVLTATPRQYGPATVDQQESYSNNLKPLPAWTVKLRTFTMRKTDVKRLRVRQGKAGPNGKTRTELDVLAKAKPEYAFGKVERYVKEEGFNHFGEQIVNTLEARPDGSYGLGGYTFQHSKEIAVVKGLTKLHSHTLANEAITESVGSLLRQALLFKGIGLADMVKDLEKEGAPVTYMINVTVEVDRLHTGRVIDLAMFNVYKVCVKKVFKEPDGSYRVFFDGKCCRKLNLWLQSLRSDFVQ